LFKEEKKMTRPKKRIRKADLRRFLKQGKKRRAIAQHYRTSESSVDRWIRKYRLSHFVRKGRAPLSRKPQEIKPKPLAGTWVSVKNYVRSLDNEYHFVNVNGPPLRHVNQKTLVCSNTRRNPAGQFTTVGIYSIVYVSNVYFLFATRIRYSQQPKPFQEIHEWVTAAAPAILEEQYHSAYYVVRIVAYTFHRTRRKPKGVRYA
jgi:hypothetical protein